MATRSNVQQTARQDAGLVRYMNQVFSYMTGGVALSGLVAWFTVNNPAMLQVAMGGMQWVFLIVWFGFGFFMHRIIFSMQPAMALGTFIAFSALTGFSLSPVLLAYTGAEISTAFFIAAVMFGGSAVYGYTTQKSLAGWGGALSMMGWGLIGLILAYFVMALFGANVSGLSLLISVLVIPFVAAATMFEVNMLKNVYHQMGGDQVTQARTAIFGASSLYMNFVVMFLHILNLLGALRGNN